MKNLVRFIRKSTEYVSQQVNSIHKKQSQYLIKTQSDKTQLKSIKFSRNDYPQLDKFFVRFFNSKPIEGRVSGKSLAFVVGAQSVGKTEYIEKNLHEVKRRKIQLLSEFNSQKYPEFDATKSPQSYETQIQESVFDNSHSLIIRKNYKEQGGQLNFINFIEDLHDQILAHINDLMIKFDNSNKNSQQISNNKAAPQPKNVSLLTADIIKEIVIHEYAAEYIFIHIKDVIFAIIQEKDMIHLNKQHREILQQWNDQYLYGGTCTFQHFYQHLYHPLIQLLWNATKQQYCNLKVSEEIQKTQIALKLFYSVFMRMEYENRPAEYAFSQHQTGIETSNFLFDILNFLSGTGKYIQSLQKAYTKASNNQERQQAKKLLQNSRNFILLGNHVDIMLCLMNIEELMCFKNKSKKFLDFFDHIVCRTVSQSNIRKHFPVMIQIPNRAFLDDTLQLGKIQGSNPVIIQVPGYIQHYLKFSNLIELFDEKKAIKMFDKFGRNPHTWKSMIENMAKGISMNEIEDGNAPYQNKEKTIAEAKMNRVYTSLRCLKYLDDQSLDFQIRNTLEIYSRINGMGRSLMSFIGTVLFKQPYFTSMLEQNIFYHMYYLPYVDYAVSLPAYLSFYRDSYLKQLKKNHSWLQYKLWLSMNKEYSLMKMDIRYKKADEALYLQNNSFGKQHVDSQFWTTYYSPIKDYGVQYYNNAYDIKNG